MIRFRLVAVSLLVLAACKHDAVPAAAERPTTNASDAWVAPPPSASAAASATATADGGVTNPYAELPPIETKDSSLLLTDRIAGYSKDDKYLGFEISTCDPCPSEFHFTGPGVPAIDLHYRYDPGADGDLPADVAEKKRKAEDDAVNRKLASLGVTKIPEGRTLRGPFPYPDLVFSTTSGQTSRPGTVALMFGAHVASEPANLAIYPIRIELGPHPMLGAMPAAERARIAKLPADEKAKAQKEWDDQWGMSPPVLAYANVTKDGRELGVVALASGSMWFEAGATARMSVAAFVGQVYNDTGMRRHKAADYSAAAGWFEKAEAAKPDESLFSYNLACAYAQRKDPRAKDALARALQRAGADAANVKARARKDGDFEAVRAESWFADLTR